MFDRRSWIPIDQTAPPQNIRVLGVGPSYGRMIVIFQTDGVYDPIGQDPHAPMIGLLPGGLSEFTHWVALPDPGGPDMIAISSRVPPNARAVLFHEAVRGHLIGSRVLSLPGTVREDLYYDDRRGVRQKDWVPTYWAPMPDEPQALGIT